MTLSKMEKDDALQNIVNEMINKQFTMFPFKFPDIWNHTMKQIASFWFVSELDLKDDLKHWDKLTLGEREFIKTILAFFAASDGIVSENISKNILNKFSDIPEITYLFTFQNFMENVHSHTYSLLIEKYIKDAKEKDEMFNAIKTHPSIRKKAEWALKWIYDPDCSFLELIVAMACVEGIHFSSSFLGLYWLKQKGVMPGLTQSNELIARDEGSHQTSWCIIYWLIVTGQLVTKHICRPNGKHLKPLKPQRLHEIISSAVEVENYFVESALQQDLVGMNADLMKIHVKVCADGLLHDLGAPLLYNEKCPFEWMNMIVMTGKTSFFERKVTEYQHDTDINNKESTYESDSDFDSDSDSD